MTPEEIAAELDLAVQRHVDEANRLHRLRLAVLNVRPAVEPAGADTKWVRVADAADFFGVSPDTVWRRARAMGMASTIPGQRLIRKDALDRLGIPKALVERM